jgi:hypothetical protein
MICPRCHQEIPDAKYQPMLGCPRCLQAKAYQEMLERQKAFLSEMQAGKIPIIITKPSEAASWHMALLYHPQMAWCGQTLNARWTKKKMAYPEITLKLCDRCEEVFGEMEVA